MAEVEVTVEGRRLTLRNLDKVFYPDSGFSKGEMVDYYARVAPVMVPHLAGRGVTLKRFPDGVEGSSFFEKRCPTHRPEWVPTVRGPGPSRSRDSRSKRGSGSSSEQGSGRAEDGVDYCSLDSEAALVWAANLAALEIHAPMALGSDLESPTMCVFDLDPGPRTDITHCARVALDVRELLGRFDLSAYPKTSGSKGMQVYVPLNTPHTHDHCSSFALAVAQVLEQQRPDAVTSVMRKDARGGKVFVDWSQNSRHKTTVAPYSLRARAQPTVSTPLSWDEVGSAADGTVLSYEAGQVLERVDAEGDLFAETLRLHQELPASAT